MYCKNPLGTCPKSHIDTFYLVTMHLPKTSNQRLYRKSVTQQTLQFSKKSNFRSQIYEISSTSQQHVTVCYSNANFKDTRYGYGSYVWKMKTLCKLSEASDNKIKKMNPLRQERNPSSVLQPLFNVHRGFSLFAFALAL